MSTRWLTLAVAAVAAAGCAERPSPPASTLVRGALLVDGTGAPGRRGDLRIAGDRIAAIGELAPAPGERVIDATGLALAPGFIDTHSHADADLAERPEALAAVSQGVTTAVVGQDGESPYPLAEFFARLERSPAALNVAAYAGHNTLRSEAMGNDFRRPATADEVAAMRRLLRQEMAAGALGLSTGLEYDPGIYSHPDEVLALAREAAAAGGRYISHVRSEDRAFEAAVDELLTIGRETGMPVQISHLKLAMRSLWGTADALLARLDRARAEGIEVTADLYPYTYWQSGLTVLFPARDFSDRTAAEFALREIAAPEGLLMSRFDPDPSLVGRTVAEIAAARGEDAVTTLLDLIAEAQALEGESGEEVETVIGTSMAEADVERLLAWPHANVSTDGALVDRHPRATGTYPRILGRYVRERRLLSLEEAVHKMTALAAAHMGLTDRGVLRPGAAADLVLFDPATVIDRATPEEPELLSEGVVTVWVNGVVVYDAGAATGGRPGWLVRRRPSDDGALVVPYGSTRKFGVVLDHTQGATEAVGAAGWRTTW